MPDVVSVPGVELCRTGTWDASTGVVTLTADDLASMVTASTDAQIDAAPVKIGHNDKRFDGDPAMGWVENLRVVGDALVGDLVDVPAALAAIIPAAFRRRSVEIYHGVKTPGGKTYRAVLSGLALLGIAAPAVKGLADVLALYEGRTAASTATHETAVRFDVIDADAMDPTNPATVYRELARAGVTALAAATATPPDAVGGLLSAIDAIKGGDDVKTVDEKALRELLGIDATADVTATVTALKDRVTKLEAGDAETDEERAAREAAEEAARIAAETETAEDKAAREAAEAAATGATVTLSAGQFAELKAAADMGASAFTALRAREVEEELDANLRAGRIAPRDVALWRERLGKDYDGTATLLKGLTPVFPVSELGSANATDVDPDAEGWAAFEKDVFGIDAPQA